MPTVALHTLGCKVNQYETQKIAEDFAAKGFRIVSFSGDADAYIINSCTVTHTADSKSRQAARSVLNRRPNAVVVVTGCYAETAPDDVKLIDGVTAIIGNRDKPLLVEKVMNLLQHLTLGDLVSEPSDGGPQHVRDRTRALLKIQDGCDQYCSYCAVPFARSVMWSKPLKEVIAEAGKLANSGYKEIVLTGIRVGRYCDSGANLTDILRSLADIDGIQRIRLSSIEVTDIPAGLFDLMAENPKICRHFHIPLQSGDDEVLRRMNRPYTAADFLRFAEKATLTIPDVGITTDIIVGFPGETSAQFENTYSFAESVHFSRAHIFRYSARRGTKSASMKDDVPAAEKDLRSARLMELAARDSFKFASRLMGTTVGVLIEKKECGEKIRSGFTDNYVRVVTPAGSELVGEIVEVCVESVSRDGVRGRLANANKE